MKTIPLGTSGVQVSALCLGAMYLGTKQDLVHAPNDGIKLRVAV